MTNAFKAKGLTSKLILGLMLVMGFSFATFEKAQADNPQLPRLSLTGTGEGYLKELYPGGRIWVAPSDNGPREFLLPVFIQNDWQPKSNMHELIKPEPIKDFKFHLFYDSTLVRPIGYETVVSNVFEFDSFDEDGDGTVIADASGFNIDEFDSQDKTYLEDIMDNPSPENQKHGRRYTIVGSIGDGKGLPAHTSWKPLIFVRFRVKPNAQNPVSKVSPIYIGREEIRYNGLNIRKEAPFTELRNIDEKIQQLYPDPTEKTGLAGMNNSDKPIFSTEPTIEGVIYVRVMDKLPQIGFNEQDDPIENTTSGEYWEITKPITASDESDLDAELTLELQNIITGTRLRDVRITTDQKWLSVEPTSKGSSSKDFEQGIWIDNGILSQLDPLNVNNAPDDKVFLNIVCDKNEVKGASEESEGVYVGHITLTSENAVISPVRVKVTFIYFRSPWEPTMAANGTGIRLNVRNSRGSVGDETDLVFGSAPRATDGVDLLFGEEAYNTELSGFGARFYPVDPVLEALIPYGFKCINPNREEPLYASRDIRSNDNNTNSMTYKVKFDAAGDQNYPVVIKWDVNDFPDGAQLFIRSILHGVPQQATNMRTATSGYYINDPEISEFIIEYTLPTVIEYVDNLGNPIIEKGWNLLSVPVSPINNQYKTVYPNAVTKPQHFAYNIWEPSDVVTPGYGYFIKYNNLVDVTFAGAYIDEISVDKGYEVRVYPGDTQDKGGWNAIGGPSIRTSIANIQFDGFNGEMPTSEFTLQHPVYEYNIQGGYKAVNTLDPARGYWIKVDANGFLRLKGGLNSGKATFNNNEAVLASSTELNILDNAQHNSTLYLAANNVSTANFELPPAPIAGMFDVRFEEGTFVTNQNESIINLQGIQYPVSISMVNADADYKFVDAATNRVLGFINKGENSNVEINGTAADAIKVIKVETNDNAFEFTVAPNPVSSNATITYNMPSQENVNITLYDELGNKVMTLVNNEVVEAGLNTINLDAANLTSGNYICKLNANGFNAVLKVVVVK